MAWATGHISPPHAATSAAEFSCRGVSRPRSRSVTAPDHGEHRIEHRTSFLGGGPPASWRESLCFGDQSKAAGSI